MSVGFNPVRPVPGLVKKIPDWDAPTALRTPAGPGLPPIHPGTSTTTKISTVPERVSKARRTRAP